MIRRPPESIMTATLFPNTTPFRSQCTNNLNRCRESREAPLGVAFASGDGALAGRALRQAGIQPGEERDLKRILEDPDGEVWPRFKLLHMPTEATPGTSDLICHHLPTELLWRPDCFVDTNAASRLTPLTSVRKDTSDPEIPYHHLFGSDR